MNFKKFINSDYLKSNPLCAISTYKDELNLATGACTRRVKKLVLDGSEGWNNNFGQSLFGVQTLLNNVPFIAGISAYSSHFKYNPVQSGLDSAMSNGEFALQKNSNPPNYNVFLKNTAFTSTADFKAWLAAQYANGTPVTIWYVLAEPTTETVTVPSGLTGTVEGYLNQSDTPTPTNPIYPTANTVEQWVDLNHYIMGTSTDTITTPADIYANDTTATVGLKGNMEQNGAPTPISPIQPNECGEMTRNLANLYGVDKTALSLNFKTGDNMTIVINGTKASGANVTSVAYPNITLPAGTYTVRIKMIGGTISNITGGAIFGINASTYSMRTTPQISKVGDIGIRTFTLTEDTLLTSLDITPSYGDVGSVWDNATFECWLYSGSDDIPYEPYGYFIEIEVS